MVPYGKTCYVYKIDSSCYLPSTDKYDLHRHCSINGKYPWFSEGSESHMAHIVQDGITFCTSFPNPFESTVLFVASKTVLSKKDF